MKRSRISIRRALPADAVKIRNLHVASIRGLCAADYTRRQIDAWSAFRKAEIYRKAMAAGERYYIAVLGDRILGFSCLLKNQIRAVYVHPRFARKGVGKRLLQAVEKHIARTGFRRIFLNSSITAITFYIAAGYRRRQRLMHTVTGTNVRITAYRMIKTL